MLTFLFWNVNKKPLQNFIAALVEEHRVDVLILAESEITDVGMLRALNPGGDPEFHLTPSFCPTIKILPRQGNLWVTERPEAREAPGRGPVVMQISYSGVFVRCDSLSPYAASGPQRRGQ